MVVEAGPITESGADAVRFLLAPNAGESAKPLGDYSLGAFASGLRDLLAVLGVTAVVAPGGIPVAGAALAIDIPIMIAVASWIAVVESMPSAERAMP